MERLRPPPRLVRELGRRRSGPFLPVGDGWFTSIERAKVLAGRLPDPTRDDEIVVNEAAVKDGAHLGMTLTFRSYTPADYATFGDTGAAKRHQLHGPVTKMKVVGVVRMPLDYVLPLRRRPRDLPQPGLVRPSQARTSLSTSPTCS